MHVKYLWIFSPIPTFLRENQFEIKNDCFVEFHKFLDINKRSMLLSHKKCQNSMRIPIERHVLSVIEHEFKLDLTIEKHVRHARVLSSFQ